MSTTEALHADHQRYVEEGFRQGDAARLRELYTRHAPTIVRWVQRNSGSEKDGQDIFQEAMVVLYERAVDPRFRLTAPVGAFLFRVCQNKWLQRLKQKSRLPTVSMEVPEQYKDALPLDPDPGAAQADCFRLLDATFAQLSELCRDLLTLLQQGIAPAAVAEQLGMAEANTVYRRKHACIDRWRKLVREVDPDGECQKVLL
jgi:RNA polymerase sigma factor (sigma-70 family)